MAGEVGHVVYAARMLTFLGNKVTNPSYWIGTLFPDVRHLGIISRTRTHPAAVSLSSIVGSNDFHTGMRVHAWIDAVRVKFFQDMHLKEVLPWHPFIPFCLNLYEDELLYSHFEDWDLILRLLSRQEPDEQLYLHSTTALTAWHTLLQNYLQQPPTDTTRHALILGIGLSESMAIECNNVIRTLRKDKRAEQLLEKFWQHLEDMLR